MVQVSQEIDSRVTKKISQELSKTENRIQWKVQTIFQIFNVLMLLAS